MSTVPSAPTLNMTTTKARRVVVASLAVVFLLTTANKLRQNKAEDLPRSYIGIGGAGFGLAIISDTAPEWAGPLALTMLVTALLVEGGPVFTELQKPGFGASLGNIGHGPGKGGGGGIPPFIPFRLPRRKPDNRKKRKNPPSQSPPPAPDRQPQPVPLVPFARNIGRIPARNLGRKAHCPAGTTPIPVLGLCFRDIHLPDIGQQPHSPGYGAPAPGPAPIPILP